MLPEKSSDVSRVEGGGLPDICGNGWVLDFDVGRRYDRGMLAATGARRSHEHRVIGRRPVIRWSERISIYWVYSAVGHRASSPSRISGNLRVADNAADHKTKLTGEFGQLGIQAPQLGTKSTPKSLERLASNASEWVTRHVLGDR